MLLLFNDDDDDEPKNGFGEENDVCWCWPLGPNDGTVENDE